MPPRADSSASPGRRRTGPVGPAPWATLDPTGRRLTLDDIRARLAALRPAPAAGPRRSPGSVAAAVLVPLFEADGEACRDPDEAPRDDAVAPGRDRVPGRQARPGVDPDLRATALREAQEEIGLDPDAVEIVARLDGIATVASRFVITPFVGFLADRPTLTPDPREVVRVFEVPLSELMADGVYREERWDGLDGRRPRRPLLRARPTRRSGARPRASSRASSRTSSTQPLSRPSSPVRRSVPARGAGATYPGDFGRARRRSVGGSRDRDRQDRPAGLRVRRHRDRPQPAHTRPRGRRHHLGGRRVQVRAADDGRRDGRRRLAARPRSRSVTSAGSRA